MSGRWVDSREGVRDSSVEYHFLKAMLPKRRGPGSGGWSLVI